MHWYPHRCTYLVNQSGHNISRTRLWYDSKLLHWWAWEIVTAGLKKNLFSSSPAWFLTLLRKVSITFKWAEKQALPRVTGAPSLCTNTWKYVFRSKISDLPPGPCRSSLSFGANIQTNTCTKVPSKCWVLSAARPQRRAECTCTYTCTRCAAQVQVQVFPSRIWKLQWSTF